MNTMVDETNEKSFLRARVTKNLHKEIKRASVDDGIPLEQIVGIALEEWLNRRRELKAKDAENG